MAAWRGSTRKTLGGLLLILDLRLVNKLERAVFFQSAIITSRAGVARLVFGVAGTFARGGDFIKNRVLLTVHVDALYFEEVAAGLALDPQLIATCATEGRHAAFEGGL